MNLVRLAVVLGLQSVLVASVWAASHANHASSGHGHDASTQKSFVAAGEMPLASNVVAENCWLRLLPAPAPSAGYFVIRNNRSEDQVVISATADAFDDVMVHQTRHENGLSRMAMVSEVVVGAGQALEFKPGSYHLMLEKPNREVRVGDTVEILIALKSGKQVATQCEVKPAGTMPHSAGMSH